MSLFRFLCRNKISKEEARLLPWHLQEGYRYDEQVRDFLGDEEAGAAFFSKIDSFSLEERVCIIYKAKRYWREGPVVSDAHEDQV